MLMDHNVYVLSTIIYSVKLCSVCWCRGMKVDSHTFMLPWRHHRAAWGCLAWGRCMQTGAAGDQISGWAAVSPELQSLQSVDKTVALKAGDGCLFNEPAVEQSIFPSPWSIAVRSLQSVSKNQLKATRCVGPSLRKYAAVGIFILLFMKTNIL